MKQITKPSRALRVAHVILSLEMGGEERLLVEMARRRNTSRFDWTVIVLGHRGTLADDLEAEGVHVISLNEPSGFRPSIWHRLERLLRQGRFDVVHTHNDRPLVYGMPAAWGAGVRRRVHTHHHGWLGHLRFRHRLLLRMAAQFCQDIVCVSHDSLRYLVKLGVRAKCMRTVWNGIDLERFSYLGPCSGGSIVTIARLSPEKDVANLLRAVPDVVAMFPSARFEIAGAGRARKELERLSSELKVREYVTFLGEIRDIPGLLARAQMFVLPSQTEGISLTLLEAMARGLPIVATDVGGNPEVVEAGVTGLLVAAQHPKELAEAIQFLLDNPAQARQMGDAGRRRVEDHFAIGKMTATYEELYEHQKVKVGSRSIS